MVAMHHFHQLGNQLQRMLSLQVALSYSVGECIKKKEVTVHQKYSFRILQYRWKSKNRQNVAVVGVDSMNF